MIGHLIFYSFSLVAVSAAIMVVTARNPVRSVLALVVTFFAMASIWMLLYAEFLSLILLLVYVGAVMTLFLFVVMMLPIDREQKHSGFVRYWPFGLLVMVLLVGMLIVSLSPREFLGLTLASPTLSADYNNTEQLGLLLFTDYLYPFEIAGMLLLAAIIAAIALTHRKTLRRRSQRIAEQVAADPRLRLTLLKTIPTAFQAATRRDEVERAEHTDTYVSTRDESQRSRSLKGEGYIPPIQPGDHHDHTH